MILSYVVFQKDGKIDRTSIKCRKITCAKWSTSDNTVTTELKIQKEMDNDRHKDALKNCFHDCDTIEQHLKINKFPANYLKRSFHLAENESYSKENLKINFSTSISTERKEKKTQKTATQQTGTQQTDNSKKIFVTSEQWKITKEMVSNEKDRSDVAKTYIETVKPFFDLHICE